MNKLKTKLNNLNSGVKFIFRIIYPVLLYTLMYFAGVRFFNFFPQLVQLIFLLIWGGLEWYFFLSNRKE